MRHVHRVIFYALVLVALGWSVIALRANPLALLLDKNSWPLIKTIYVVTFTAAFWPIAYIELVDYIHSRLGKNGALYLAYAKSVQKDLVVATITALVLATIYWMDSATYGLSSIDIAFVGFPFLVNTLYSLIQATQLTLGGQRIRKRAPLILFGIVLTFTGIAAWLLVKNAAGELEPDQALFLQLTILFVSLNFFLSSNFVLHA